MSRRVASIARGSRRRWWPHLMLMVTLCAILVGCTTQEAHARSVLKGIFDNTATTASPTEQQSIVTDMAGGLRAQVMRFDLYWDQAEPTAPGEYDVAYLDRLLALCHTARAAGLRVMIDVYGVPEWASDQRWWDSPPPGYRKGYAKFYPVATAHLADWEATTRYLGTMFKGLVSWWECWNEPNLMQSIYPQRTAQDPRFSARAYVRLLKPFYRAINEVDPGARVLGGVTAPLGRDNIWYTKPQTFARSLKALRADRWWDGYSHHPYLPATRPMPGPLAPPLYPADNVTLSNIGVLLRLFPRDPFYLTEYGYPTKRSPMWGSGFVSEKTQAKYLSTAYRMAARHKQIRMLCWFLWKDIRVEGGPSDYANAYMGLRRPDGSRKPAWYAFARLK
jgi:hypothetical protein